MCYSEFARRKWNRNHEANDVSSPFIADISRTTSASLIILPFFYIYYKINFHNARTRLSCSILEPSTQTTLADSKSRRYIFGHARYGMSPIVSGNVASIAIHMQYSIYIPLSPIIFKLALLSLISVYVQCYIQKSN